MKNMRKLHLSLVLLLTTGLFSCSEVIITPKQAFEKFGTDSAALYYEWEHSGFFNGEISWTLVVDIKDKDGVSYRREIEVSDTVYRKAKNVSRGNYIKFK